MRSLNTWAFVYACTDYNTKRPPITLRRKANRYLDRYKMAWDKRSIVVSNNLLQRAGNVCICAMVFCWFLCIFALDTSKWYSEWLIPSILCSLSLDSLVLSCTFFQLSCNLILFWLLLNYSEFWDHFRLILSYCIKKNRALER